MATTYRYQHAGIENGPVRFRELVQLVRDGILQADDLVIADWQQDWGPAAEVVGLFHTAGRDDVLEKWQQEQKEKHRRKILNSLTDEGFEFEQIEELLDSEDSYQSEQEALARLEQLESERLDQLRQRANRNQSEIRDDRQLQEAIGAALSEKEEREKRQQQKSIVSFLTVGTLQSIFRMTMALAVANLVTYLVFSWSIRELQRFPDIHAKPNEVKVFPIYGKCSEAEFFFLMFDTMVFSGIAGYGLARGLEFFVDE